MVLSTDMRRHNADPDLDAKGRTHRFPAILSLAIVLMKLKLKKTFEFSLKESIEDLKDKVEDEDCSSHVDLKLYVANNMLKELQANQPPESEFIAAIEACINFGNTHFQTAEIDYDVMNNREHFYSRIFLRKETYQEIVVYLSAIFFSGTSPASEVKILKETSETYKTSSQEDARAWIEKCTNASEKHPTPLWSCLDLINNHRVKIARLDTGIDLADSLMPGAGQIIQCENWAQSPNLPTGVGRNLILIAFDASGHGTHIAALLLKIAPDCDIYVGRVADASGTMVAPDKIAEAISHAVVIWKVDMIIMSLGFGKPIDVIEQAFKEVFVKDVIIFAAASNGGRNEEVAFPASAHEIVIGVHSTDANGNKSSFSLDPPENSDNFGVLGEAIESSWSKYMKMGSKQCQSGTSYATPIAAGIAASLMLFARIELEDEVIVKELRKFTEMKKLMKLVSKKTSEGYCYLRPWEEI